MRVDLKRLQLNYSSVVQYELRCNSASMAECKGVTIPERVLAVLPSGITYHACNLEIESFNENEVHFRTTLWLNLSTKEEFEEWLQSFQETSHVTWRVRRTVPTDGVKVLFKKSYRCQHNTLPAKASTNSKQRVASKNTNCKADMMVKIRVSKFEVHKRSRSKDHPDYQAQIVLNNMHNHPVECADALKHRDVSETTKAMLTDLFQRKYGPTQAVEMLKFDLQLKHGDDYHVKAADRAVCPDIQFAHRLYRKVFKEEYGESCGEDMLNSLRERINQFNAEAGSTCMAMDVNDNQLVVAICTPLMKRVHEELKHSGELVFMDASSNMDRHGCNIFLMLTHSCIGGIPLGVLVTTSESEVVIKAALQLYTTLLSDDSFGGKGLQGPAVFMTDDCAAEQHALQQMFPSSTILLCVFHVLQATWRWLWDAKNGVQKHQRPNHLQHMKRLIYADTAEQLEQLYQQSLQDPSISVKFKKHLTTYMTRKNMWAICLRNDLNIRGNNTNNFCEAAMRVLKDKVLERTKAFSVPQLVDFVSTFLQDHYYQRLIDVANGRLEYVVTSRFMLPDRTITKENIEQVSPSQFKVKSQSGDTNYHVDTMIGHCSCPVGKTGGPCKHQAAVVKHFKKSSTNFVPVNDMNMRLQLYKIATDDLLDKFHAMCDDMAQKANKYPDVFKPAMNAMVQAYTNIKTDASLLSAMHCFGKSGVVLRKGGRMRRTGQIGVQPTATARRRPHMGRGGKRLHSGRPTKSSHVGEHAYANAHNQSAYTSAVLPVPRRKRNPAPHCLSHAVSRNKSLGKTHSAK
ncbi:uncharacterized protein LOC121424873 isoform X1 [Lytechinus variegatus]|uniref:uncharacterized protein LOC121424873 isoform X1 n=2 Tax=Lytechinus variegatus TaxID=7654 RepID=UPI001BB11679|nr:uncharacterized protein LOC121424873 isoform X1 [Lytechinus variegatus]